MSVVFDGTVPTGSGLSTRPVRILSLLDFRVVPTDIRVAPSQAYPHQKRTNHPPRRHRKISDHPLRDMDGMLTSIVGSVGDREEDLEDRELLLDPEETWMRCCASSAERRGIMPITVSYPTIR